MGERRVGLDDFILGLENRFDGFRRHWMKRRQSKCTKDRKESCRLTPESSCEPLDVLSAITGKRVVLETKPSE